MTHNDFNSDSTSTTPVVSAKSPIVDLTRERRSKNYLRSTSRNLFGKQILHQGAEILRIFGRV